MAGFFPTSGIGLKLLEWGFGLVRWGPVFSGHLLRGVGWPLFPACGQHHKQHKPLFLQVPGIPPDALVAATVHGASRQHGASSSPAYLVSGTTLALSIVNLTTPTAPKEAGCPHL